MNRNSRYISYYSWASRYFVILACLTLSACGFHLRGVNEGTSGIHELAVSCSSTDAWALCHHLKLTLQLHDIVITEDAPILLEVSPIRQKSRVLSLQENASAAELGLSSQITYKLITTSDDVLHHQQSIKIRNSYRHESSALLAKDRERADLQTQLSRQLAEEVVRQISVLDTTSWLNKETAHQQNSTQIVE